MNIKTISKSNLKSHIYHLRRCLIMSRQMNHKKYQTKLITKNNWIPMNPDMVLIGALKWRIHPSSDTTPVWATWLNIWWVKRKGCLKVQLTNILVFFIMISCYWLHQRKLVSGWNKRDTKICGSYLKWIYSPATPSSNATEVVQLVIAQNFVILIPAETKIVTRNFIFMLGIHIHCIN